MKICEESNIDEPKAANLSEVHLRAEGSGNANRLSGEERELMHRWNNLKGAKGPHWGQEDHQEAGSYSVFKRGG